MDGTVEVRRVDDYVVEFTVQTVGGETEIPPVVLLRVLEKYCEEYGCGDGKEEIEVGGKPYLCDVRFELADYATSVYDLEVEDTPPEELPARPVPAPFGL